MISCTARTILRLLGLGLLWGFTIAAAPNSIYLEAEEAHLVGPRRVIPTQLTSQPATSQSSTKPAEPVRLLSSGQGYVTGFVSDGDRIVFQLPEVAPGLYELSIRYCAASGKKGFVVNVNGLRSSGMFPASNGDAFTMHPAGRVELESGPNTLAIEKGWGHYDIDAIELTPTTCPPPPAKPPATPADHHASPEARQLLQKLIEAYGARCFSGVYSVGDVEYVRQRTGTEPAIVGGDLMDYSPSRIARGADPKQAVEELLAEARRGAIITVSWHWNAPRDLLDRMITDDRGREVDARWYKGFNSNATTFDLAKAMADPKSEECRLLVADIDAIAIQLRKFADAGVPVLWRPLHEAEGRWFWWGAKGPEPFKQLWRMMFDRLTSHHRLHNLIWVYTGGPERDWYPGDECVDIVGIDAYPSDVRDPLGESWDSVLHQYAGRKLIALTEFGGVPDIERMRRYGVYWAYFASWTGRMGPRGMNDQDLKRLYAPATVINRTTTP